MEQPAAFFTSFNFHIRYILLLSPVLQLITQNTFIQYLSALKAVTAGRRTDSPGSVYCFPPPESSCILKKSLIFLYDVRILQPRLRECRIFLSVRRAPQACQEILPYNFVIRLMRCASSSSKAPGSIRHFQFVPSVDGTLILASAPSPR